MVISSAAITERNGIVYAMPKRNKLTCFVLFIFYGVKYLLGICNEYERVNLSWYLNFSKIKKIRKGVGAFSNFSYNSYTLMKNSRYYVRVYEKLLHCELIVISNIIELAKAYNKLLHNGLDKNSFLKIQDEFYYQVDYWFYIYQRLDKIKNLELDRKDIEEEKYPEYYNVLNNEGNKNTSNKVKKH